MDIFSIVEFKTQPSSAIEDLKAFLKAGMPPNVLLGDIREDGIARKSGLLHVLCESVEAARLELAYQLVDTLFEYGASWMLLDENNKTPGCIAYDRGLKDLYARFVQAGVRSEVFLRQMTEDQSEEGSENEAANEKAAEPHPEGNQKDYLATDLAYEADKLLTDQQDGVMMDWETPIMKQSAELITQKDKFVLNVGFGMGIIDNFIEELGPAKHYIVEAHPQVLAKMRQDGWYDKPNVVILEGTWKKELPKLLSKGITFSGIYYDTFSEHYSDMIEFFDLVCGLLDFQGIFSYFNGLGADRQIVYDVYKQVVEFDLRDYGLQVEYTHMPLALSESTWGGSQALLFPAR